MISKSMNFMKFAVGSYVEWKEIHAQHDDLICLLSFFKKKNRLTYIDEQVMRRFN
jgi:hypothetical protein